MILDGFVVGLSAFGAAGFCFAAGFVVGGGRKARTLVFPVTHVSFSETLSDKERLEFLEEAKCAVLRGQLRQTEQLADDSASNQRQ